MLEFGQRYLEDDYAMIARVLLSVAAIAVPLFLALVVQRFFALRQAQIGRSEEYGRLQDQLRDYRHAVQGLGYDLLSAAREKGIEFDFKTPIREQLRAPGFPETPGASAKLYIHEFIDFGSGSFDQPEYRHTAEVISPEEFDRLLEAIERCSGFFVRRKYYAPVLESLGIVEHERWNQTNLSTARATYDIPESIRGDKNDLTSMAFWAETVGAAHELMLQMVPALRTMMSPYPSGMLFYSVAQAVLGILVPLGVLAIDLPPVAGFYVTYSTLALFLMALAASLTGLWKYVRAPWLHL